MTFETYNAASAACFTANMKFGLGTYRTRKISGGWMIEACFCGYPANPFTA